MKKLFLTLLIWLMAQPISADHEYESTRLLTYKAWYLERVRHRSSGDSWCNAATRNDLGQAFKLTGYDTDTAAIFVFDDTWNLVREDVRFIARIDRKNWNVYGLAEGTAIVADLDDPDAAATFIYELAKGNRLTITTASGRGIADFSLAGSRRTIDAFFNCWKRL